MIGHASAAMTLDIYGSLVEKDLEALVQYADGVAASLLVVGTRGRGDFASLILGSTSHRAIQLSKCDVLVVKAPKQAE
jgi:nucleotide-binding universal stress UspA family protein